MNAIPVSKLYLALTLAVAPLIKHKSPKYSGIPEYFFRITVPNHKKFHGLEHTVGMNTKQEFTMSAHSSFVKEVHLSTIEKMIKQGKNSQQVVSHLKSVWCDDDQIEELLSEAQTIYRLNARSDEMVPN